MQILGILGAPNMVIMVHQSNRLKTTAIYTVGSVSPLLPSNFAGRPTSCALGNVNCTKMLREILPAGAGCLARTRARTHAIFLSPAFAGCGAGAGAAGIGEEDYEEVDVGSPQLKCLSVA